MQLSIIILNYNVQFFLEQCIHSVQKAIKHIDAEIIVVDNDSMDDSCAMVKSNFPEVTLIENHQNLGFPKGNNQGVAIAKGNYICILNPDTVVGEDTFEKILSFAEAQSNLGIVGVKLIDGTGTFLPESKRGVPTPWVAFTKISGLYQKFTSIKSFNQYYAGHLQPDQTGQVDILVGAFMFMKRQLYRDLDGFDENCFMYSDDIDLSYKAKLKGLENYYFADTTVLHYKGESTLKDALYVQRFQEAMAFFYQKHFKKAWFFTGLMKLGSSYFVNRKATKTVAIFEIDFYYLYSKEQKWVDVIQSVTHKKVLFQSSLHHAEIETLKPRPNHKIEILFDVKSYSYREILQKMELHKGGYFTFKMISPQHNYMIGSNSSDGRGEVIEI
jgi:GT2 family glycosyltransferase